MVSVWAENSGLRLNTGKTEANFIGSKKGVNDINSMDLLGIETGTRVLLLFSSEVVSLGVTIDSKLTWKPHINQITKKVMSQSPV